MKVFNNYEMAIEYNDYLTTVTTDDNYNIIEVIAEQDVNEKRCSYKKGDKVILSERTVKSYSETLREENTDFSEED